VDIPPQRRVWWIGLGFMAEKKTPAKKAAVKKAAPKKAAPAKKAPAKKAPAKKAAPLKKPASFSVDAVDSDPDGPIKPAVRVIGGDNVIRVNEVVKPKLRARMANWFKRR
jgi:hypothetical protein